MLILILNPRVLKRLEGIKKGDEFLVDSFFTGREGFRFAGGRSVIGTRSRRSPAQLIKSHGIPTPSDEKCVVCRQAVYHTNRDMARTPRRPNGRYGLPSSDAGRRKLMSSKKDKCAMCFIGRVCSTGPQSP